MIFEEIGSLFVNVAALSDWRYWVMWAIGGLLIYLAIAKDMEPTLLLPLRGNSWPQVLQPMLSFAEWMTPPASLANKAMNIAPHQVDVHAPHSPPQSGSEVDEVFSIHHAALIIC